jgi:hypothetical protein
MPILYKVYEMNACRGGGCVRLSEYVFSNTTERFPIKFIAYSQDYKLLGELLFEFYQ